MSIDQLLRKGFLFLLLAALLPTLSACAPPLAGLEIADLQRLPQEPSAYLDPATADLPLFSAENQHRLAEDYLTQFFAPWQTHRPLASTRKPFWAVDWIRNQTVFGINLRPVSSAQLEALVALAAPQSYPSLDRTAISLRRGNLRALPTRQPLFNDPQQPGEGFPFDGLQHSALAANTPLHVTHISTDGAWVFVETARVYGWLPVTDLAWVDAAFMRRFTTGHYRVITSDHLSIHDVSETYRFRAGIGSLLPTSEPTSREVLVAVAGPQRRARLVTARLAETQSALFPLLPTPRRIASLAASLVGQTYDWGGQLGSRDCSATLQDLFTPFGLWLPRNSNKQAELGRVLPLATLPPAEREQRLLSEGVPFLTLVALPGHIMLYLGEVDNRAVLLHTLWGLRTQTLLGREGRWRVGQTVITSLDPGQEASSLFRSVSRLRDRIRSMNLLVIE